MRPLWREPSFALGAGLGFFVVYGGMVHAWARALTKEETRRWLGVEDFFDGGVQRVLTWCTVVLPTTKKERTMNIYPCLAGHANCASTIYGPCELPTRIGGRAAGRKVVRFPMSRVWEGEVDRSRLIGLKAIFTTWEGEELIGVVEDGDSRLHGYRHLIARFSDGKWARLDDVVRLIVDEDWEA